MKKFVFAAVAATSSLVATVSNAAVGCDGPGCTPAVPEINAYAGLAAVAVLAAVVALVWERRRAAV